MKFYDIYYEENFYNYDLREYFDREEEYERDIDTSYVPGTHICRCSSPKAAMSIIMDEIKKLGLDTEKINIQKPFRNTQGFDHPDSDGLWSIRTVIV
jgi:hypothetical protein